MKPGEEAIRNKILEVIKPWGKFRQFTHNEICTVKILTVAPQQKLSKQAHENRDELWIVLDGGLQVEIDDVVMHPEPGDEIVIMRKSSHRLSSAGDKEGRVLEVSFGIFHENDIVRFDDIYGRTG